jgi:hypothetical protein
LALFLPLKGIVEEENLLVLAWQNRYLSGSLQLT